MNRLHIHVWGLGVAVALLVMGCGQGEMELDSEQYEPVDTVDIDGGEAAWVVVDLRPTRHVYDVGTAIEPTARVFEPDWTELDSARVEWIVTPAEAVIQSGDQWILDQEGEVVFEACVIDGEEPTSICGEQRLEATDDERTLVLESPVPGAHFTGTEHDTIPVAGRVDGALSLNAVRVNDELVSVDQNGEFIHQLEPSFGINTIEVRPADAHASEADTQVASVMWAPDYRPPASFAELEATFDNALVMGLGQQFLDDGQPYHQPDGTKIVTRDLSDLLELVLEHIDLDGHIPTPVVDTEQAYLAVPETHVHDPQIELLATDDGLELYANLPDLEVETDGHVEFADETIDLHGSISAALSIFALIRADKPGTAAAFDVELVDFGLAIEQIDADLESIEAEALFEVADGFLRDALENLVVHAVEQAFIEELPEMIAGLLDSADERMTGHQRTVDPGFIDPLTVGFDARIGHFNAIHGVGLTTSVGAAIRMVDRSSTHPHFSGIPRIDPLYGPPPLMAQSRFQLGIDFELLNAVGYLLWDAGIFDVNITDVLPDSIDGVVESGEVEFLLPPVIRPPRDDELDDLVIHLGQFEVEVELLEQKLRFGFELVAGARFDIVDRHAHLEVGEEPEVKVWLIESTEQQPLLEPREIRNTIESFVWPELRSAIAESVGNFALPVPTLEMLEDYAPALSDMEFVVELQRRPGVRHGFLMVEPTIEGQWTP